MARDAVTVTKITKHTAVAIPGGVTINTTNGANITGLGKTRKLILIIQNTITNLTKVATIKAGVYEPAALQGQGDLALVIPAGPTATPLLGVVFVTIEAARFLQADGSINVDYATGMTGFLAAVQIPDNV
jgi:hypothetical protein